MMTHDLLAHPFPKIKVSVISNATFYGINTQRKLGLALILQCLLTCRVTPPMSK